MSETKEIAIHPYKAIEANSPQAYRQLGLTDDEASALQSYVARGRPGIHNLKADTLRSLYVMGYSCQDIAEDFPEFPVEMLLYARLKYEWDKARIQYRNSLAAHVPQAVAVAQAESLRFLTDIAQATHVRYRQEIKRFLAAPDREKPPECLPQSLSQYGSLVNLIKELSAPPEVKGKSGENSVPLVAVNINNGGKGKPDIVIQQKSAKDALLELVGKKKPANEPKPDE